MVDAFTNSLNKIQAMQATIDTLLNSPKWGIKLPKDTTIKEEFKNRWVLEPLYQSDDCSVGLVHICQKEAGPCDEHVHKQSKEYLIVTKGKILLYIEGSPVREVRAGECCSIDSNVIHNSVPLTDDTKMIYVCVPRDTDIKSIDELEKRVL